MRKLTLTVGALTILLASSSVSLAVDGVVGLYPAGEASCIAAQLLVPDGQALAGISWFNNDESQPFPRLLLMEGILGEAPDIQDTGMILEEIVGESLAWGTATLEQPVSSSTDVIAVVFVLPAYGERTGEGLGGGPGIGYVAEPGEPAFLSHDGVEWVRLNRGIRLAVEPVWASLKGGAPTLASMKGQNTTLEPVQAVSPEVTALGEPWPNPFNPSTEIPFRLSSAQVVALEVYDIRGRLVRGLADELFPAGQHTITWHGDDNRDQTVSSGVYFVRMEAATRVSQKRLVLIR